MSHGAKICLKTLPSFRLVLQAFTLYQFHLITLDKSFSIVTDQTRKYLFLRNVQYLWMPLVPISTTLIQDIPFMLQFKLAIKAAAPPIQLLIIISSHMGPLQLEVPII